MRRLPIATELIASTAQGQSIAIDGDQAHYIRDVLRLRQGDAVELFDGQGLVARTTVTDVSDAVTVSVDSIKHTARGESPLEISLYQGIPKGKRWEWILEKVTELGVTTICPVETNRTVVTLKPKRQEHKMTRWQKKLAAATRQSQRTVIPDLQVPQSLDEALENSSCEKHLVAHLAAGAPSVADALAAASPPAESVGLWIGPEGGFDDDEIDRLSAAGATVVSLGPRVLRADTAAIATVTLVQAAAGDLGPG